jgi:hypothetical protein
MEPGPIPTFKASGFASPSNKNIADSYDAMFPAMISIELKNNFLKDAI